MVEHGIARRRRARQSVVCHSMAWRCVVKNCITKRCNAKHGIARRDGTQHRSACHGMAPGSLEGKWIVFERSGPVWSRSSMSSSLGSPETSPRGGADGEHPLALLSTSPSQSRSGAPASYFLKATTPQSGGGPSAAQKSTNRHRMRNHFRTVLCFLVFMLIWKDRKRQCCSGSTLWNN